MKSGLSRKWSFAAIAACLYLFLFTCSVSAQTTDDDTPIKVDTILINIPLIVSDRDGRHIAGLTKDDFSILLDGEKQTVEFFADADAPVNVAIIIDISGSVIPHLSSIREAAQAFVQQLNSNDQAIVLTFDQYRQIEVVCPLTNDKKKLAKKIGNVDRVRYAGGWDWKDTSPFPGMYNTIHQVVTKEFASVKGRKAMIVLTDGFDSFIPGRTVSESTFNNTIIESDTVVYPMMFLTRQHLGPNKTSISADELSKLPVTVALNSIASKTGGRLLLSAKGTDFKIAFANVADELRKQYVIGFYPSNTRSGRSGHIALSINRPEAKFRTKAIIRVKPLVEPK